jgi:thiol-disulfide isomerase/thioredoxin
MKVLFLNIFIVVAFILSNNMQAQEKINWLTFEQLEDSLAIKPKKVLINFYADWCAYCKKMDKAAFKNGEVVSLLNGNYYAVKMDAESTDSIQFDNKIFINKEINKKRNPTHEIPLLLGQRKNKGFVLPFTIILDEKFNTKARYFEYLSPKRLNEILESNLH